MSSCPGLIVAEDSDDEFLYCGPHPTEEPETQSSSLGLGIEELSMAVSPRGQ